MKARRIMPLLVALASGCDIFAVETEFEDACINFNQRVIDGAPSGMLQRTFTTDELEVVNKFFELSTNITELRVALTAEDGVNDLTFLDNVRVTVTNEGLDTLELVRCENGDCASTSMETELAVEGTPLLNSYIAGHKLQVTVIVTGPLPTNDWTANLSICMSGSAKLSFGP